MWISLHRASTLPPTATSTATSHVTTFYRASKSSIDRHDSLDWKQTNKRKSTSNTHGQRKRLNAAGLDDVDSSPFKQLQRAKASRKTYGSKRALAPASSLSSTAPLSSSSYPSTSASSFSTPGGQRGISKSILRSRLEECFHSDSSPASGELSNLVNRTIHLFQAYDNILQLVYPPVRPGGGGGRRRSGKVTSLVEISAREIGWEIETNIRDWLRSDLDEDSYDDANTVDVLDKAGSPIWRRRATNPLELDASSSGDEEEELSSRRTSTASVSMSRGTGVDDMSRGEQDLEASRLQDEAYESCPSHTYRWILAEHATCIVYNELVEILEERGDELPHALIDIWFDWCLSYGADSEASRFHPLLVSTALSPAPLASSHSRRLTTKPLAPPFVLHLLLKSPSPLALLSDLELYLSASTFQDKLFFHPYLSIPSSTSTALLVTISRDPIGRIQAYLRTMIKLARTMVQSYLDVYENEGGERGDRETLVVGLEKDTNEIFERVLKLVGAVAGDTAIRNIIHGSTSGRWKGKKAAHRPHGQNMLVGLTEFGQEREDNRRVVFLDDLRELSRAARDVKEIVGKSDRSESSDSDDDGRGAALKMPTVSEQLGSIVVFFDLVNALQSLPSPLKVERGFPSLEHDLPFCESLLSHYLSSWLSSSSCPTTSLLSMCDIVSAPSDLTTTSALRVEKAILSTLRYTGGGNLFESDEIEQEIETRLMRLEHTLRRYEAAQRPNGTSARREKPTILTMSDSESSSGVPAPSRRRPLRCPAQSFDSTSDSDSADDIVILSPPRPAAAVRSPPRRPSRLFPPFFPLAHSTSAISSEPDELTLLPPPRRFPYSKSSNRSHSPPRARIPVPVPMSPSPSTPSEHEVEHEPCARVRTLSPTPPPPRRRQHKKVPPRDHVPMRIRKLECHVRTHSAPPETLLEVIGSKAVRSRRREEEDDEDELMMSF
ncbi:hypothetical protein JCM3766R1_004939 [Sporobolomyces carnicolor]